MIVGLIIAGIILLLVILFTILAYNSLIKSKNEVDQAFADVDVYLKKRYDLIPNLVNTVKGYAKHEEKLFLETTQIRAQAIKAQTTNEIITKNNELSDRVRRIFAITENYPDLKASSNFLALQKSLNEIEAEIATQRGIYNQAVTAHNNNMEVFPKNIVGKMFKFKKYELFEIVNPIERENVIVQF